MNKTTEALAAITGRQEHAASGDLVEAVGLAVGREVEGPLFDPFQNPEAFDFACRIAQAALSVARPMIEAQLIAWLPIETAPKDTDLLVWYDHKADPYLCPNDPKKLTDYAVWAEGGDFLDGKGHTIAKWHPGYFECEDEYGSGYWLPAAWFSRESGDYESVVNPIYWMPLPAPPAVDALEAGEHRKDRP